MGQIGRMLLFAFVMVQNMIIGIIWLRVGVPMIQTGRDIVGDSGSFVAIFGELELVVPLYIAITSLGAVLYVIAGPVQQERTRRVRR